MPGSGDAHDQLERSAYVVEFEEHFTGPALDARRWLPDYLPHWTTPERSAARYDLSEGRLLLRIDADQPAWRAADGELRVSSLQSGSFSGPVGSRLGQHRHRPDLTVVTPQPSRRLYTPSTSLVEATLRASTDPSLMLTCWLVGFEEVSPEDSGEICVVELFGDAIGRERSELSLGVKAHHDPRLRDDMARVSLPLDAAAWHRYAAAWNSEEVRFFVDDRLVRTVRQSITYPLQLMVSLFEFPAGPVRDPADYPKVGEVGSVLGCRPAMSRAVRRDRDPGGRARNARPRDGLGRPLPRGSVGVPRIPDDLVLDPLPALAEAQRLLDAQLPFHAHEILEGTWKAAAEDERDLWQGLAQLAVGLTHVLRGNRAGAATLVRRGRSRIEGYAGHPPYGIDVPGLLDWADNLLAELAKDRPPSGPAVRPPRLRQERGRETS